MSTSDKVLVVDDDRELVKTIVDRMGGQVWVRDESPLGGILAVCFPAANAEEATEPLSHATV